MDSKQDLNEDPYLSVVAVSRNDNHGGRLTYRMQKFVDGFITQCKRHNVHAELILVEWNPPEDRPFLNKALKYPKDLGPCSIRIVQVPPELHQKYAHANSLPLFQMIGKNVGIRRAKGKFILATNIDILFSDALFKTFKKKKLKEGVIYRCDRLDIPAVLPETDDYDEILKFCKNEFFLINRRGTSLPRKKIRVLLPIVAPFVLFIKFLYSFVKRISISLIGDSYKKTRDRFRQALKKKELFTLKRAFILSFDLVRIFFSNLHFIKISRPSIFFLTKKKQRRKKTKFNHLKRRLLQIHSNACGDFTLLSKKDWELLRGYVEWPMYSFHIDSILMYQGILGPLKQKNFGSRKPIYHIEHQIGSGYTPQGVNHLFDRLDKADIPYLTDEELFNIAVDAYQQKKNKILQFQKEDWGLIDQQLPEYAIKPC